MTQPQTLERSVAAWMAEQASTVAADPLIDQILTATAGQRPKPRWLALLQESPMHAQTQVVVGSPTRRFALTGALLLLLLALGAAVAGAILLQQQRPAALPTDWNGFRGDATHQGLIKDGPLGKPVAAWTYAAAGPVRRSMAVVDGLVMVPADDGTLTAVGLDDGLPRWQFSASGPMRDAYGIEGRVYVVDGTGILHAFDAADGTARWASAVRFDWAAGPVVADGLVYVGTNDGLLIAFDEGSGQQRWSARVGSASAPLHWPSIADGLVVAAADDGAFAAFDAKTGAPRWSTNVGPERTGTPVFADGLLYLGSSPDSTGGGLTAYDPGTGAVRWTMGARLQAPSVLDGIGYTAGADGAVTAFDLATRAPIWRAQLEGIVRAPVVTQHAVYAVSDSTAEVVALDRTTGGELWRYQLDNGVECCLAVTDGKVIIATRLGTVYAIAGDGSPSTVGPIPSLVAAPSAGPVGPTLPAIPALTVPVQWVATNGISDYTPTALAVAPDGRIWTAEGFADQFSIFEPDGTFVETWGKPGTGEGEFDLRRANGDPYGGIAFAPDGTFYILDVGNYRVQVFDKDRKFVRSFGEIGSAPGQFSDPVWIAVEANGDVSVLDDVRGVIETYHPDGTLVSTLKAFPDEVGVQDGANALAIGPNGHYYLTIFAPVKEVLELDRSGALVRTIGAEDFHSVFTEQPGSMAFDAAGNLYVTQGPDRGDRPAAIVFAPDGTVLGGFGDNGPGDDEIHFPWQIVVEDDAIYVTDFGGIPEFRDHGRSALRKFAPLTLP